MRRHESGVTLIEMLVVVTIVALFATISWTHFSPQLDTAKQKAARTQIEAYVNALQAYKLDTGAFPADDAGLQVLWEQPAGVANWHGPYVHKMIAPDAWGRAFVYHHASRHGDLPEVISLGADGKPGGSGVDEDIVSWKGKP